MNDFAAVAVTVQALFYPDTQLRGGVVQVMQAAHADKLFAVAQASDENQLLTFAD
ncbi:hypothetical protein D3C72_2218890 [compost metagenome]